MNENPEPTNQKGPVLKLGLAVLFIGVIILIAWSSIKLVRVAPQAFSSLASLAESLNRNQSPTDTTYDPTDGLVQFTVTSNSTLINTGDTIALSWDTTKSPGSYTFHYVCVDGVDLALSETDGNRDIACDTNYNIGNLNNLSLTTDSTALRYAEVDYTIAFLGTNDTTPRATGKASFTIVNGEISDLLTSLNEAKAPTDSDTETMTDTTVPTKTSAETAPKTTTVAGNPAVTPTYQQEFTYTIPVSDPNGRTDLAVSFGNTGTIVRDVFFVGELKQDETGAIQFVVKNYGTKTSKAWTFSVTLPNDQTYTSERQTPLKPNERAVLTIGFKTTAVNSHNFVVTIDTTADRNTLNDRFSQTINFLE